MILDDIVEKRKEQLEREKENFPLEDMRRWLYIPRESPWILKLH